MGWTTWGRSATATRSAGVAIGVSAPAMVPGTGEGLAVAHAKVGAASTAARHHRATPPPRMRVCFNVPYTDPLNTNGPTCGPALYRLMRRRNDSWILVSSGGSTQSTYPLAAAKRASSW